MTNQIRNPNSECKACDLTAPFDHSGLVILSSFVIRISSFPIYHRHFPQIKSLVWFRRCDE